MATLEKIRGKAGLLVTVVGLAIFAFIIGDLLNSSSSFMRKNQNNVVVVDGNAVDYQDYMNRENALTEIYKLQTGSSTLSDEHITQIRQSVYDEIVMENVMDPRLEELGIVVTPEEMTDMVEGENISPMLFQVQMFQNPQTGRFDRNRVITFLNQIKNIENFPEEAQAELQQGKAMWMFWEKNIKRNRLNEKYTTLLSKAVAVNSLEAQEAFNNTSENSDIVYVMQSFAGIADSTINVSRSEIKELYNERKERFRQKATCLLDYIAVDISPSQEDYDKALSEMEAIHDELSTTENVAALTNEKSERRYTNAFFSVNGFNNDTEVVDFVSSAAVGDIYGPHFRDNQYRLLKLVEKTQAPDSVKVFEMLLAPRATEAETTAYADSILNELKGGADFSELVSRHSIDNLAQSKGEIGWITEAGALQFIGADFKNTVFSLPAGQCASVKSNSGLHIVKVTERTQSVPKYKIADIQYTVIPSSTTRSKIYNELNQFIANNNSIEKMAAAAKENGFNLVSDVRVRSTDVMIGNITGARQVVRWAFNEGGKGAISDINECDDRFVVVAHKGIFPEGYQSLESVTPQLRNELIREKKGEIIASDLKSRNLSSIDAYASVMETQPDTVKFITMATANITGIGIEPKLNALISTSPLNTISEPVAGNNGVYVFEVINRAKSGQAYDEKRETEQLKANTSYRVGGMAVPFLMQDAEVEDNRVRFY